MAWTYFKDSEIAGLENELVARLDQARHLAGIPFIITSGKRTPETNTDPNAATDSAHLKGMAVDLLCRDSHSLFRMTKALMDVGFNRLGVYFVVIDSSVLPTHIHADIDGSKPQEVLFLKVEK